MFESLRYRWASKDLKGIAFAVALLTTFAAFELWRILSSDAVVQGVVVSTDAVSASRVCGGTRQIASVQLSDGGVVYAFVDSGGPLQPGTLVSVQKLSAPCDIAAYEVVALR